MPRNYNDIEVYKMIKVVVFILSLFSFTVCLANSSIVTMNNFVAINQFITTKVTQYGAENSLLVFDDDDTLLTTVQGLGGVGWYNWQSELLQKNPQSPMLVAHDIGELLKIQTLLFAMSEMSPTSTHVLPALTNYLKSNIPMIIETSRGPLMEDVTLQQLQDAKFINNQNQLIFQQTGVKNSAGVPSIAGDFPLCNKPSRDMSYDFGVFFTSGLDKGQALQCLLQKLKVTTPRLIIFVDDTESNINNMYQAYLNTPNVEVICIHYTKENQRETNFVNDTTHQQELASHRWKHIRNVITKNIEMPDI